MGMGKAGREKAAPGFADLGGADLFADLVASASPAAEPASGADGAAAAAPPAPPTKRSPHFHNHRWRLRERFLNAGTASLADYELLGLVLFRAIPRRDVKPLAKQLLERFGDFNGAISAPPAAARHSRGR